VRRLSSVLVRFSPPSFLLLLVPLLLGSARSLPQGTLPPLRADGSSALTAGSPAFQQSAAALRLRRCTAAIQGLEPLRSGNGREALMAQLVSGFYAHACEQPALAEERLFAAVDPGGPLEDWRLFLLADSAAANGHLHLAQATLARLLADYPDSPLRPRAWVRAARLALANGDTRRAVQMVRSARAAALPGGEAAEIEGLAWEIGTRTGDSVLRAEAARRLLVLAPGQAADLKVIELFRRPDGSLDWSEVLTAEQLAERARTLLALNLAPSALVTLEAVRPAGRDLEWQLLHAEALTSAHRGAEALTLLAAPASPPSSARQRARLEWARSQAAADVATAQRGRTNLPAAERQTYRWRAQQHLEKTVEAGGAGGDTELAIKALRLLFADHAEAELFDRALATLKRLRTLDPADQTGAEHLWQRGWSEYSRRNYTGAVGYWAELVDLYPESNNARRGRYWSGRAFEALGETQRAAQVFAEVAGADTSDLYRRSALTRLQSGAERAAAKSAERAAAARAAAETWPDEPRLRRARLLSDLGLDALARSEMEVAGAGIAPRARAALDGLLLARTGQRRKSIPVLREAFPALGTPYQAGVPDAALRLYYPLEHQETIRTWAELNRLPSFLVYGIIRQESAFDTQAQSWAGARGLMQLMPATARELAGKAGLPYSHDRLSDPAFNVRLGTTYFRQVLSMFDDNVELALAGYNGGPYRIKRLWRENGTGELDRFLEGLTIEESKTYVKRILVLSDSYRQLYPTAG
jgi:soluble lytic murein transglycosylase-like protein